MMILISGCGGGIGDIENVVHEEKEGMWVIREVDNPDTILFRGTLHGMVDENYQSAPSIFISIATVEEEGITELDYLLDINGNEYEFSMIPEGNTTVKSYPLEYDGRNIELVFDPDGKHTSLSLDSSRFGEGRWTDHVDANTTLDVSASGSMEIQTDLLYQSSCTLTIDPVSSEVNFVTAEADYQCGDKEGKMYLTMVADKTTDKLIIHFLGDVELMEWVFYFEKE